MTVMVIRLLLSSKHLLIDQRRLKTVFRTIASSATKIQVKVELATTDLATRTIVPQTTPKEDNRPAPSVNRQVDEILTTL